MGVLHGPCLMYTKSPSSDPSRLEESAHILHDSWITSAGIFFQATKAHSITCCSGSALMLPFEVSYAHLQHTIYRTFLASTLSRVYSKSQICFLLSLLTLALFKFSEGGGGLNGKEGLHNFFLSKRELTGDRVYLRGGPKREFTVFLKFPSVSKYAL